jgi:hypothetical protein
METTVLVTNPSDEVELVWMVGWGWTPETRGDYLNPPEGGLELVGDPQLVEANYYPEQGEDYSLEIGAGSIADILLTEKYGYPPEEDQWEVVKADQPEDYPY